jgi:hypothetical protein
MSSVARLYTLCESQYDAAFLRVIFERVSGWRVPNGSAGDYLHEIQFVGVGHDDPKEVRRFFSALIRKCCNIGAGEPIFMMVVRDNDRGPFTYDGREYEFPEPVAKTNRFEQLRRFRTKYKANRLLPVPCVVGVSVQMIETWVLLAANTSLNEAQLPLFSTKYNEDAKRHYGSTPDRQLKELFDVESKRARGSKRALYMRTIAENCDLHSLEERSVSFRAFVEDIREQIPPPQQWTP